VATWHPQKIAFRVLSAYLGNPLISLPRASMTQHQCCRLDLIFILDPYLFAAPLNLFIFNFLILKSFLAGLEI
jgi:hypothetical protein